MTGDHEPTRRLAVSMLLVLTAINFVNFLDRQVVYAVLEPMSAELGAGDARSGLLATVFLVAYMVASPVVGSLGDRVSRTHIVAASVGIWSLGTVGSGLAPDYSAMFATRVVVGIGEAGFAAVAPTIIADLFRPERRGRMLAYFYLGIPVGSALGYLLGGIIAELYGWRSAFFVAGGPGLLFAVAALWLPEPVRGSMDEHAPEELRPSPRAALRRLWRSPAWRSSTAGITLMTFAMGGLAAWTPTFLQRTYGLSVGEAGTGFGAVTVLAGLIGTLWGGWLGDRAQARGAGGYFRVSGWGLVFGAPFIAVLPLIPAASLVFATVFVGELLLFLNTGPLNAAVVASVPATMRARAVAAQVFVLHALGDAISPPLMGLVSERWTLGAAVSMTAIPLVIGGIVLLFGARRIETFSEGLLAVDGGGWRRR